MPLFLLCRLRISRQAAAAAAAAAGGDGVLGLATGQLTMGPTETVVGDGASEETGGDEAAGDTLRVWRHIRGAVTGQLLQRLAAAETAAADPQAAAATPAAAGGSPAESLSPLLALRKVRPLSPGTHGSSSTRTDAGSFQQQQQQ